MHDQLHAGATLDFETTVDAFPPSDGWALHYLLTPRFTTPVQAPIQLDATTYQGHYRTQAGISVTANWASGWYHWASFVDKTGIKVDLEEGEIEIRPNSGTTAQGFDGRSRAKKMVDDLLDALAGWIGSQGHVQSYSINNRSITFRDEEQIRGELQFWERRLANEEAQHAVAAGKKNPKRRYLRMSNA